MENALKKHRARDVSFSFSFFSASKKKNQPGKALTRTNQVCVRVCRNCGLVSQAYVSASLNKPCLTPVAALRGEATDGDGEEEDKAPPPGGGAQDPICTSWHIVE